MFKITEHIEFDAKGRAFCPSCGDGYRRKALALIPDTDGAYKCHRGCTPQMIREAIGVPKDRIVPASQVHAPEGMKSTTVSPQKIREAHEQLMSSNGPAKEWLHKRGITDEHMREYKLGIGRAKVGDRHVPAIIIPIPANAEGTAYYQKKRVAPWDDVLCCLEHYKPWSQYGIPARVFFTHKPDGATETWLCEGEWDAMMLGHLARTEKAKIAIASFTCGAGNVPEASELAKLPGQVKIFYDWNDKPLPDGSKPGEKGAIKAALALGDRARIATVPHPDNCSVWGWDVSNAIDFGYDLNDLAAAAEKAFSPSTESPPTENPLRTRLQWNDDLLDTAPDYTEWLVPDLLTNNELFLLASGPRAGKSLLAMTLAHAVASGTQFLERPVTQGTVIYVRCEDSPSKTKEREEKQGWARGLPVAWINKFKLSELDHLRELANELDPRLIVLDTLSRIKDGNVSESSAEMSQVLEPLQEMADALDCCILLVHHTGKVSADNADKIDIFDTIRGSSAIRAVCRGSMVIAAGERDYRLLVENGWGKHDLKVMLDANTLSWRLLGRWNPITSDDQRGQVIEYLKQVQSATLEQIHEATAIPKASLYVVLSRMQTAEEGAERIVKEGGRRRYTYRMALSNTIELLNSLLNSGNPDTASDTVRYLTKNDFPSESKQEKSDHLPDSVASVVRPDDQVSKPDHLLNKGDHSLESNNSKESSDGDHFLNDHPPPPFVKYRGSQGSKADEESISPIEQLFNKGGSVKYTSEGKDRDIVQRPDHPPLKSDQAGEVRAGDKVLYTGKNAAIARLCGRKQLEVRRVDGADAEVKHKDWIVSQTVPISDLRLL